jgi:hypothetical protein
MSAKTYLNELERALARPDADQMRRQLAAYADYNSHGIGNPPIELADDFEEVIWCHENDHDKSLAYVVIAASEIDDAEFLGLMGCSNLENVLRDPRPERLERIVREARRSARFGWLLSYPYKVAIAERAWDAITPFRITVPHEESGSDTLPPR